MFGTVLRVFAVIYAMVLIVVSLYEIPLLPENCKFKKPDTLYYLLCLNFMLTSLTYMLSSKMKLQSFRTFLVQSLNDSK